SLLGAFAFSDIRNRTLIPDDPARGIAQCTRVFQDYNLLSIASAHPEFRVANLTFRLHTPHELGTVGGVPIEHGNAWQCVEFLSATVAENGNESGIDRLQSPLARAL